MTKKMIPVETSFAEWRKHPRYRKAYDALEEEFSRATKAIKVSDLPPTTIDAMFTADLSHLPLK